MSVNFEKTQNGIYVIQISLAKNIPQMRTVAVTECSHILKLLKLNKYQRYQCNIKNPI